MRNMLAGGLGGDLVLMLMAVVVLVKATDTVVSGLNRLAVETRWAKFGLAAVLMAISTSLPELFVGISSAIDGVPSLALGNVVGSNIANLSLVVGGSALLGGSIAVLGGYVKQEFLYAFLIGSLPMLLLLDRSLGRVDGVILILTYVVYLYLSLRGKPKRGMEFDLGEMTGSVFRHLRNKQVKRSLVQMLVGVVLLLVSVEVVVNVGAELAAVLGVPVLLVGLFVVSIGTSLPELALWVRATIRKDVVVVFGNLLGSIVTNSTLVIGVTAMIAPIRVVAVEPYLIASITYVVTFWIFWTLTRTKRRLDRWEGAVLVVVYLVFMGVELGRNSYGEDILHRLIRLFSW